MLMHLKLYLSVYKTLWIYCLVTFWYLLRIVNISSAHGAFSLSTNVHAPKIGPQEFLLRKFKASCDTGVAKGCRKLQY